MDLFWPLDPPNPPPTDEHLQGLVKKHGIERDVGAFCYTFSILLELASDGNIVERKEELREISSRIVGILPSEGDTEFLANATRTTYKQLNCAWRIFLRSGYEGIVDDALVSKLRSIQFAVSAGYNFNSDD